MVFADQSVELVSLIIAHSPVDSATSTESDAAVLKMDFLEDSNDLSVLSAPQCHSTRNDLIAGQSDTVSLSDSSLTPCDACEHNAMLDLDDHEESPSDNFAVRSTSSDIQNMD